MLKGLSRALFISICFLTVACFQETKDKNKITPPASESINPPHNSFNLVPSLPGGTVHSMVSVGRYPQSCTEAESESHWVADLKPIIAYYHLEQYKVSEQVRLMQQSGQTKTGLVIWTVPANTTPDSMGVFHGHTVVPDNTSNLREQHLTNLQNYILLLESYGFSEIQLRFGPQGNADPSGWKSWDESQYQENKNVIFNTQNNIMNFAQSRNLKIKIMWDIGAEVPSEVGQARAYTRKLWKDYTNIFGTSHTYGFSLAYTDQRLRDYLEDIKSSGAPWPEYYSFDIYDGDGGILTMYDGFSVIKEILQKYNQHKKPLILQESYYNDAKVYSDAKRIRSDLGLNLFTVMQWPMVRDYKSKHFGQGYKPFHIHFSEEYPQHFAGSTSTTQYSVCGTPLPIVQPAKATIENAGSGCTDHYCLWIVGKNFEASTYFDVVETTSEKVLASYSGNFDGNKSFTLRIANESVQRYFAYNGVRIRAVNRGGVTSDYYTVRRDPSAPLPPPVDPIVPVDPTPPASTINISNAGSGCDDHFCLWIVGKTFKATYKVQVRSQNSTALLGTYPVTFASNASNGSDLITMRLSDAAVQDLFKTEPLRITIIDPDTNATSNTYTVKRSN